MRVNPLGLKLTGLYALLLSSQLNNDKFVKGDFVYLTERAASKHTIDELTSDMFTQLGNTISNYIGPLEYIPNPSKMESYLLEVSAAIYELLKYDSREIALAVKEISNAYPQGTIHRESSKILLATLIKHTGRGNDFSKIVFDPK